MSSPRTSRRTRRWCRLCVHPRGRANGEHFRQSGAARPSGRGPARSGPPRAAADHASLLIRHGESVTTVQARLGHSSATETLDTYSHRWPDSDDRTREAVDAVLGARRVADYLRTDLEP